MSYSTSGAGRGAAIGGISLPALLLAAPIGIETSIYALHRVDEACGVILLLIPVAAIALAIIGAALGAFGYANVTSPVRLQPLLTRIGIACLLLITIGYTYETFSYKAPLTPLRCYI